ncbi:DUF4304 domain-containing protein [Vibrio parahaemolyticus]|nr:DUF4304 domain-containing protein [Vibrio parahaemolyticus]
MVSKEKKCLESILKPALKKAGFRKKGSTWWKHLEGFIQVINIQGSQYSKQFYLNLGVYIIAVGDKEWPSESDCHIQIRLDSLANPSLVHKLLDYETAFENSDRREISELVLAKGLPWLDQCSSFDGAKAEYILPNRVPAKWQRDLLTSYFT